MKITLTFEIEVGTATEDIKVTGVSDLIDHRPEFMARLNSALDRMAEAWEADDEDTTEPA